MHLELVRTHVYPLPALAVITAGSLLWIAAYALLFRRARRLRFVEIPLAAMSANLAWELLFSTVFAGRLAAGLGWLFWLGYVLWFALDAGLFALALRHGGAFEARGAVQRRLAPALRIGLSLLFLGLLVPYIQSGRDNASGLWSAYTINLGMSLGYVVDLLRAGRPQLYSRAAGWLRAAGSLCIGAAALWTYPDSVSLAILVVGTLMADVAFLAVLARRRRAAGHAA